MAYAGEGGATLVHRRLFLTEAWAGDEAHAERRQRCGVPEAAATFRTKLQLALFRSLQGNGHALQAELQDRLLGRAASNAAARAHVRHRLVEQPP